MEMLSRKDRERQAKRQDILKAARGVFAEKGLLAATLDEIAEKAEFAKGTLYTYFENKDDLFVSMLEEEVFSFSASLKEVIAHDSPPVETLVHLVEAMMHGFAQNMDLMRLLSQERSSLITYRGDQIESRFLPHFQRLNNLVAKLIQRGIDQGAFRRLDPERTATAIFNLCHGGAMSSFLNKKKVDNPEDVKFITGLLLQGIATGR